MRRSVFAAVLVAATTFGAAAPGSVRGGFAATPPKAQAPGIKIDNFSFGPAVLTVSVGSTVTWTNRDDIPHTVVSTDEPKVFKSNVLDTNEKFSFTFTKAGTYPYFCSIHPNMIGKIIVQ